MIDIGWFSTGRDEAARQLLKITRESIAAGDIQGRISFVFSNRERGESAESDAFFDLVSQYDIPLISLSHRKFKNAIATQGNVSQRKAGRKQVKKTAKQYQEKWRLEYDSEVDRQIKKFSPDICVLAGYMLVVGGALCRKYSMINLHPAPPGGGTGSWQEVIWKLIRDNADEAGAMMHLVTPRLDEGPVISYCTFPIKGDIFAPYWQQDNREALFHLIREHELMREFPLIVATLKLLSLGEISIRNGRIIDGKGNYISGYDLSAKIDLAMEDKRKEGHHKGQNIGAISETKGNGPAGSSPPGS
ncbi:MAG: phosphoglycerate transporter [Dehalococcoidia bacterium]|nr:phosphoglycerate transporter [Dehalococcoidia bacterium]